MNNQGLFSIGSYNQAVLVTQGLDGYWRIFNNGPGSLEIKEGPAIEPGNSVDVFKPSNQAITIKAANHECSGWYEAVSIR